MTGAPLIYATSQFQDHGPEIGSDDCPPTPGDDDDDEDDKDKVTVIAFFFQAGGPCLDYYSEVIP